MFVRALILSLLAITPLFGYGANIVINPVSGFSDATATSAIGGNPGLTLGAQRLNTFQKAADILETFLDIKIDVEVDAAFSSLSCSAGSAVLGSAGASGGYINQANAPLANTIYPVALANNLALSDLNSTTAEISATFNADIDNNANCLNGVDWYYGYDDPALAGAGYVNDTSFLSVVIHELLHGLGVTSWVQSNGALNSGFMDAYSANLYDQSTSKTWSAMNDSERLSSMTNTNNLVWTGTNVNTSSAASALSDGINSGKVEMYAPNPYEGGSSVSHFSIAATPNEIMEPSYTEFLTTPGMATQLLQDIGWAVPATNNAPILAAIGAQSSLEDNNKIITLSATDADSDTISFSASSDNGSVTSSVSGTTLTLTPAANYFGTANITITANDGTATGNATDSEIFVYTINSDNDLPVFTSANSGSTQYGNNLGVTLSATDIETANGDITFAVQSSNTSQVTASISGVSLTLAPVNDYLGDTTITLRATDSNSGITDQSYVLTITAIPNTAPVLTAIGAQSSTEDNAKIITLAATDGEGDALTYAASSDNTSVTASVSGTTLTLTPAANYFGSADITVSVTDGSLSDTEIVTYTISSENDLPVFTSSASGSIQYGNNLNVTLTATDIETANGDITFAVQSSNTSQVTASISGASLTLTPVNDYLGDTVITLRATDSNSGTTDQSYVLTITATPNTAPVLTAIGAQSSAEDSAKIITLAATDGEGDALTYSASSDNASVTASVSGTTLTLTPAANYFGSADITVSVTDGNLSDTEIVTYTISSDNDLPVFTSANSGSTQYGNNLGVTLSATDIETANGDITFAVQSSNTSQVTASISGASLTLTPVNDYLGDTTITLRATDSNSGTTDQSYVLTITAIPNTAPVLTAIGAQSSTEDSAKIITLAATDGEGDALTYSASSDNASVTASVSGTTLTLTPAANYFGSANITVSVTDGNLSDTEIVTYTINSDNDLPVFTSANSGSTQYGNNLGVTLTATDIETVNGDITFAVQSSNTSQVTASISGASLTLTPVNDYIGDTNITLRATDSDSGITDQVYTLAITAPANDAPIFTSSDSLTTLYGNSLAHSLTAVDANSDELTFSVTSYNAAQISASLTSSVLTLQAVNDFTGNTSIEVSVYDGTITVLQTINLSVFNDFSLVSNDGSLSQGTRLDISNSTFEFTLGGGDNNYTVDVVFNGQSATNALLTSSAGSYSLAMPTSGAFAGDYTITITDGNGESADFIIQRPLKVSTNINQLISASITQEMYIDGAPAGSVLDLHLNQGTGLLDFKIDNSLVTQIVAPDDANNFNRAVVTLDINDASEVSVINISADSALLPAGSASLSTLPFHNVELTVTDLSGRGINTSINIDDNRFSTWGLNPQQVTDSLGNILLALPKDQATSISLSAENYQTKIAEVDTQLDQITVILELLENPMTVSGSITTSNLNFASENPVVQLSASDGSIILAQLSAITTRSVNYSITTNKLAFNAEKLIVSHGEIVQEVYLLNNQFDSRINIHIDALQIIQRNNPSENLPIDEEPIVNTGTSAGNSFILLLSLMLLVYRRKQIILQKRLNLGD
ncbi:MAG: hypothetical protein ACI978_000796 [Oleispira sp.]|jgi:hypothetical protein